MTRCSTSFVIREMQIKTTIRYHYTSTKRTKIKKTIYTNCWWGGGGTETHTLLMGMKNDTTVLENSLAIS